MYMMKLIWWIERVWRGPTRIERAKAIFDEMPREDREELLRRLKED